MEPRLVGAVAPAPPPCPSINQANPANRQIPYVSSAEWRPYSCRYCFKKFKRKDHLTDHERLHTGERPYHCQHCGRGFAQRSNCRNHAVRCPAATNLL